LKLTLEYDGSGFAGWQLQPGLRTLQGEVEEALFRFTGEEIRVHAAGRTDAGVHALGQVVSFHTSSSQPAPVFARALNALLPADVCVLAGEDASEGFHARTSARGKWYRYIIADGRPRLALARSRAWWLPKTLALTPMRKAAALLEGEHDFSSFRSATCEAKDTVRELRRLELFRDDKGRLVVELWASGFLKQMARTIVGTLVEVGQGKRNVASVGEALAARDRTRAGMTAPAQGLYLLRVDY
jgi:tRNA pseudouridine38-40 synthase